MADPEPPFEQRLRTEGAKQRDLHRGGHDPPHLDAAGEGSVNLTKQALRVVDREVSNHPVGAFSKAARSPSEGSKCRSGGKGVPEEKELLEAEIGTFCPEISVHI